MVGRDLITVLGGIGALIFAIIVAKNYQAFNTLTGTVAQSSSNLISTLQGGNAQAA